MSVWDAQHPKPQGGPEFERKLLRWLAEDSQKQLEQARKSPEEFRRIIGGALEVVIGRTLANTGSVEWDIKDKADRGRFLEMTGLLRNVTHQEELPAVFLHPKEWNGQTVIWIDAQGKTGLYAAKEVGGRLRPEILELLDSGSTVVGVDLLYQGEFLADDQPLTRTKRVKNTREAAAYTFGYNRTVFAQRVHDILTTVAFVKNYEKKSVRIDLVGLGGAGAWVATARAQLGGSVDRAVVDTGGFRFVKVADLHDPSFLPGGAKYGDLPGLLALGAPGKLWLTGEGKEVPEIIRAAYKAEGAGANLSVFDGPAGQTQAAAIKWLVAGK
jgi:hypothetical protein